jgi:hypothetical protein
MSDFPFTEKDLGNRRFLREFKHNTDSEELVWHQDQEDRTVKVIKSGGWQLQMDNELPIYLQEGKSYNIPAYVLDQRQSHATGLVESGDKKHI